MGLQCIPDDRVHVVTSIKADQAGLDTYAMFREAAVSTSGRYSSERPGVWPAEQHLDERVPVAELIGHGLAQGGRRLEDLRHRPAGRSASAGAGLMRAGGMLALRWNRLPASYSDLILASRSYLARP